MGDLLLKGWAMLADVCPACSIPIMEARFGSDAGTRLCVGCGGNGLPEASACAEAEVEENDRPTEVESGSNSPAAPAPPPAAPPRADPSELLAARMLQGWAMLGVHCPVCQTPLVRSRQREMWCVSCDARVMTPEEHAAAAAERSGPPAAAQAPASPAKAPAPAAPAMAPAPAAPATPPRSPARPLAPVVPPAPVQQVSVPASDAGGSTHPMPSPTLSLEAVLSQKMAEALGALSATRVDASPGLCTDLVRFVRECEGALRAARGEA